MDIPKLSMAVSTANTSQSISIAVMKKAMDAVEQQGEDLIKMIQATGSIDIKM